MDIHHTKNEAFKDLLSMHEKGNNRGFLTRTCYYCYIVMRNQTKAEYPSLKALHYRVLSHKNVQDAIQETACCEDPVKKEKLVLETKLKAESIAGAMIGTVTSKVIRFCGWLYLVLLKQVSRSVQFSPSQIEAMHEASCGDLPVVYMPLHYSHLDYILVSLILFHNNVRVPYIASGNNLHLPLIGYFIKRAGGFFIRRRLDEKNRKDTVYRSVLQTYITELLKDGQSLEIFLEGTRSRSGLPNVPKTGLLSVLVDAIVDKQVPDVLIVPVHTSYEKLFEGNFHSELLGKPKRPESLWDTVKSVVKIFFRDYGHIKINFAKPISLKSALSDICMYSSRSSSTDALSCPVANFDNPQVTSDLQLRRSSCPEVEMSWRRNISYLAEHIIFHGLRSGSFMSTHLVAFLLVNQWRSGVSLDDLVASYSLLKTELMSRGRDLGVCGNPHDVVLNALTLLGDGTIALECRKTSDTEDSLPTTPVHLGGAGDASVTNSQHESIRDDMSDEKADSGIFICESENCKSVDNIGSESQAPSPIISPKTQKATLFVTPISSIPAIFELSYYSNALTPVFAIESIVCLSITATTGFRFSMIDEQWKLNNGADIFEDCLPNKMRTSFLRSTLVEKALGLCDFLQMDLILCDVIVDIEDSIQDAVQDLVSSGCLISNSIGSSKMTHMTYGIDEEENFSDDELLKVSLTSISQILCHQSVLAPYVEALAMVTEQLKTLESPLPKKQFLLQLLDYAQTRTSNGLTTRTECGSSEVLSHCIHAFKTNKVLESVEDNIVLSDECRSPEHLNKLLARICQYMM